MPYNWNMLNYLGRGALEVFYLQGGEPVLSFCNGRPVGEITTSFSLMTLKPFLLYFYKTRAF